MVEKTNEKRTKCQTCGCDEGSFFQATMDYTGSVFVEEECSNCRMTILLEAVVHE